jgi:hypothetical protein
MELDRFTATDIEVAFADYADYPEYPQLHGGFEQEVLILDLLIHTGVHYMKSLAA